MKKSILVTLVILAVVFLFGFIGWALSSHGAIGLLRLTPIFLYVLIVVIVVGLALIGLFLWYRRLIRRSQGPGSGRIAVLLWIASIICILLFPFSFIQLEGLPQATDIHPISQLVIPSRDGLNLHFAVGSDAHFGAGTNNPSQTSAMLSQIGNPINKFDLFFFLGDLVEYGFKDNQWNEAFQAFSPAASRIPTRFAPGNHDTLFGGISRYENYCSPPEAELQKGSKLWYRVDVGKVHFLVLDVEWSAETFTQAQKSWLETQLTGIPARDWKIVMSHGFYYSSGYTQLGWNWYDNPETISALSTVFEKYDVDMVFSGHNHYLEYLQHSGVNYVICGGFGGKPDPVPSYKSPSSIWFQQGQFGFADVAIDGNQATLNFRDPDSKILKSFTITRH